MTNYDIFDEPYYLSQYPWVKPAIDAGIIKSGREHFEKFGQAGCLTKVSRYFDEETYLSSKSRYCSLCSHPKQPKRTFCFRTRPLYPIRLRRGSHSRIA